MILILVLGGVLFFAKQKSFSTSVPESGATYNVGIMNFTFSPDTLTINAGDTVVWTNIDSVNHDVVSDSGSELNSTSLLNGQKYSHTFTKTGTFNYHCGIHPSMKAKVIVR